jgi:predicted alpha/beta-hydrolase family hydrolase
MAAKDPVETFLWCPHLPKRHDCAMAGRQVSGEFLVDGKRANWLRDGTVAGRPLVVLAHGAGAPLTSPFMEGVARGLVKRGMAGARFHFPYMEDFVQMGKRRPPNPQKLLLNTWESMLQTAARWRNVGPLVLAGKSMGGRMASVLLAEERAPQAVAAVYLGYPLHPPRKPEKLRSEHLPDVPVPQLFVSGSKDNLCRLDLLEPVLKELGRKGRLHVVEGGDHSLCVNRKNPLQGSDAWLDVVASFVAKASK